MPVEVATSSSMSHSHSIPPLTAADFRGLTLNQPGLVLVDFSAAWCPPCRVLEPVIVGVHASLEGRLAIGQVDCDVEQEITQRFGVVSMPTADVTAAIAGPVKYRPR